MSQKRMAAELLKCGISRVRVMSTKEAEEALTRQDVRDLIKKGVIVKIQKRGTSRGHARIILRQKKRGRRQSRGSRKGTSGARSPAKRRWIVNVRPMRSALKGLRDDGRLATENYRELYTKVKGGFFRNKKHMLAYAKENDMIKEVGHKGGLTADVNQ
ncbi:MAG: 50S ribosomal protein L19e [Candidatus Aenigmarchaeota archaeon]|nr:50S ribosomal protein L19e [Candidatus Aenigmarchaeota archaeon]